VPSRIRPFEALGLEPLPLRAREAWLAIRGDASVPPTRFGLSSLRIFHPRLSVTTWLGRRRPDRQIPISNLFNRTPTPLSEGWSVRKTQVRDFRGGTLSYDSHNGTDFAIPVGTVVTAAAAGKVLRISSEYNRGGLKIFIDHGAGLITTSNHLARSLVEVGDEVERGQPIALSGYSGIDALVAFPWSVPHVHFNVWLNGDYVDPFAAPGEVSLWLDGNAPVGKDLPDSADATPTSWDEGAVRAAIEGCVDDDLRHELSREPEVGRRAMNVLFARNYYPTKFTKSPPLFPERAARAARLSLPFRSEDFVGIVFP
jgi:murein DD-endopeptidase MepM/ murein hydrolase activator NlpD